LPAERPEPTEVVVYEGTITLVPPDEWDSGAIVLDDRRTFLAYVYERLEVPLEDGTLPHVKLNGRITLEVYPDPDARWLIG
jgi:hypothetical protein